jgi:4-oxalomesaconate tautomerase
VVLATAGSFGLTGYESHEQLAGDAALLDRIDTFRRTAGQLMGLGETKGSSVPKTVLVAPARDGGQVCTRSFIPVRPHSSVGVLAAISVVTGMLLPGAVGHELTAGWPPERIDVEHPTGHLLVDVAVRTDATPPRVIRSGVVRTARKLFDGIAYPRAS